MSFVGAPFDVTIEMLEKMINKHNLTENAKVTGPMVGHNKYQQLQQADLFVFPTYNEAFPLVILEAMQFRLPVISTFEWQIRKPGYCPKHAHCH